MTSLDYGLDMPYEVQLEHTATSATHMTILEPQRSPGQPATRHLLTPGVYMISFAYNGAQAATLSHAGGGTTNTVTVPTGTAGAPRTSAPIKISVQGTAEHLHVAAPTATGGTARATISVIPAPTFDEMAESAQGVSVLTEINNLKTTKADKTALDSRVPLNTALRLDATVGTRIFAGTTMIHGDTGWRNIASLLIGDWTATTVQIRREGSLVTLRAQGLQGTTAGFLQLPSSFVTSSTNLGITTSSKVENVFSNSSFALSWRAPGSVNPDASYWAQGTWQVTSGWPTTLPGTPA